MKNKNVGEALEQLTEAIRREYISELKDDYLWLQLSGRMELTDACGNALISCDIEESLNEYTLEEWGCFDEAQCLQLMKLSKKFIRCAKTIREVCDARLKELAEEQEPEKTKGKE